MSMSFDVQPSVRALRAEAETNRARLTGTVEELRTQVTGTATDLKERLSPSAIKAEVTDYVRDSRDQLWHSLEQKARDNPLQAVAVGAALAFPAFKLLRAMPAPLLLVGAGLLLSRGTGDAGAAMSQATDTVQDRARSAVDSATDVMDDATSMARRKLHDAQDYVREGIDTVQERAAAATSSVKERVTEVVDDAKSAVGDMADKVIGQGSDLAQQARTAAANTWDQNPLLVAGVGLLIGSFIAAAFPATQTEETLRRRKRCPASTSRRRCRKGRGRRPNRGRSGGGYRRRAGPFGGWSGVSRRKPGRQSPGGGRAWRRSGFE